MKNLIWILIIICTPLINLSAQVTADFEADIEEACESASVTFTNLSIPVSGLTYYWDFGNGHTSVLKNPVTAYTHTGFYTVKLIVSDGINSDTIIKTDFIKIWNLPVADFNITENISGCAPLNTVFQNLSIQGDGIITEYEWDFGDGTTSSDINPVHTYDFQSNYAVSLSVTDEHGCIASTVADTVISVFKPSANFMTDYTSGCLSEANVNFYNNSEGIGNLSYTWNFGDGETSNEKDPIHYYSGNGNYDVSLTVTDAHSCEDTLVRNNYIDIAGVLAAFDVNKDTLCPDESLILNNTSENAYSYKWDFGDNTFSVQKNPVHTYNSPGTYTITLIAVHMSGCTDTITKNINIENITADFVMSDRYACELPAEIHYTNLSQNAVSYEWHFGKGEVSYEMNPTVIYDSVGIFSDTLITYSLHGCRAERVLDSSFIIKLPKAYFVPNQWSDPYSIKGCAPLTVNFKDKSNYYNQYDSIKTAYWTFGDGYESNEINPVHVYTNLGKFPVHYYYVTERGCVSSAYFAEAKTGTKQHADFYKNLPDTICASQAVQFFDNSQDTALVNEWYWRFGDGKYSMKKNPVHMYVDTGYMNVKLQVYYNGCGAFKLKNKFIYIKGPVAKISDKILCENPYNVLFSSNIKDAEKVYWNFGDGSAVDSLHFNPHHLYPDNKTFYVKLTAVNNTNACSYYSKSKVTIRDVQAHFTVDTLYGCENLKVNLNSEKSQDIFYFKNNDSYALYYWDFGDGYTDHINSGQISHYYRKKGVYNLKLLVKDFRGCADSLTTKIKIYKPEPDFYAESMTGCMPKEVQFKNTSQIDTLINKWLWNFGDGQTSYDSTSIHTYNQFGLYDVSLLAEDILGCVSDTLKINYIDALRPIPDFTADYPLHCFGDTINFIPSDTSKIVSYLWDFGDGTTSAEQYPKHSYNFEGLYNVSLSLVDDQGCDSVKTINNYVSMQNYPIPQFTSADSVSDCYPLTVNFTDSTQNENIVDWYWDFGDGETSSHLRAPEHIYTVPGIYDVSMNVTTSNGCSSEIIKPAYIDLRGPYAVISAPDMSCKNEDLTFIASNKRDVYDLQWIFGDGATANSDTAIHAYNVSGTMRPTLLIRSDTIGTCDILLEDSIYIPDLYSDIIIPNNQFEGCNPFTVNMFNNCSNANNWLWDFGDGTYSSNSSALHIYNAPGLYNLKLTVQDIIGCKDSSELQIESYAAPSVEAMNDSLICRGDEIQLYANGAFNYEWFPKKWLDEQNVNKPFTLPDSTITYTVNGTDINGCSNTSSVTIKVQQEPYVNLRDTAIIIGENVVFNAYSKDIKTYSWYPDYNINCTNCFHVTVNPIEPTNYEVTVTDTANCFTNTYDAYIDILRKYTVDIPDAFTPDGNGINDVLYVRGWGIEDLVSFKIFNRFGEMVFNTNDKNIGWDGTYKGKKQNIETYSYVVTVKTYDNTFITKRGTFKLLK